MNNDNDNTPILGEDNEIIGYFSFTSEEMADFFSDPNNELGSNPA